MNKSSNSFLDAKSLAAIVFVALSWFVWDGYMKKKYPHLYKKTQQAQVEGVDTSDSVITTNTSNVKNSNTQEGTSPSLNNTPNLQVQTEKITKFDSENLSFDLTNMGMGLKNITLHKYKDRDFNTKKIKSDFNNNSFETKLMGVDSKLYFNITKQSENRFIGTANKAGLTVVKTIDIDPLNYSLKIKTKVENIKGYNSNNSSFKGIKFYLTAEKVKDETSIMNPMMTGQDLFVKYENTDERLLGDGISEKNLNLKNVSLVNLGETYFSLALINNSNTIPTFNHFVSNKVINGQLNYPYLNTESEAQEVLVTGFIGPKDTHYLKNTDPRLLEIIDYGWFDTISRWLLSLLKSINSVAGNWGLSIIIMTLIIKVLLLPFYLYSSKSMKRMQLIQPEIKKVREKYKDNPQEMNMRVMGLMRDNKANPVSGCLPMIIPIPIFFAFYRVLGQSIDLYQAPFALWIQDLSLKDPYYILPVLMSIAMFFQMKISPSAMDPMQKKVMMFMPLLFGIFMLALPSGLTLYIFISTLFGIIQHMILMRDKSVNQTVLSKA